MGKDSLARGERSATFVGGTPGVADPVEFHGTVAQECEHGTPMERTCVLCERAKLAEIFHPEPKSIAEIATVYEPMNGRVLLRKLTEENQKSVVLPDAFRLDSDIGIVIASSDEALMMGDKVRYGHYNAEEIEIEGETLILVAFQDIRLRIRA